jgi:DNA-directed RNA polymerase I, II, and III subunit RPABC2
MLYYNIQMSEQVETAPITQGESDAESVLSGTDNELTDIEEEQDSKSTSPIAELQSDKADEDDDEDDDDDDEELDSEMLRKLEKDEYSNILTDYHPEIKQNNYNDIVAMCQIVRDGKGVISDDFHKTIPWLTKYERARVLGIRTKQLNNGADPFVQVPSSMISGYKIAIEELKAQKIPFIIRRPIPNGGTEYWRLEDLELLGTY